jgi:hypothetical protein
MSIVLVFIVAHVELTLFLRYNLLLFVARRVVLDRDHDIGPSICSSM